MNHRSMAETGSHATSAKVQEALNNTTNIEDFLVENAENMIDQSLPEHLMMLLEHRGLKRADVIRGSGIDKAYIYQIFIGEKRPSRDKLIAIAFGLHLSGSETQRMLKLGGHSELYPRVARDATILFAIQNGMDIWSADDLLSSNGFLTILDS